MLVGGLFPECRISAVLGGNLFAMAVLVLLLASLAAAAAQPVKQTAADFNDDTGPGAGVVHLTPAQFARETAAGARQAQALSVIPACTRGTPTTYSWTGYLNVGDLKRNLVFCSTPASGSVRLNGGSHVLYVSNPNRNSLNIYSTDGVDCTSTSQNIPAYYAAWSDNSWAGITSTGFSVGASQPAPCQASTCCTVLRCNNRNGPCSVSVYSYFSGVTAPTASALPSPRSSASPTPSRSKAPSASATPTPSGTRAAVGQLPSSWDPRTDAKYRDCYTGQILNQGKCGSCYAKAAAHMISIALCRTAIDENLLTQMGGSLLQVSSQQMLGVFARHSGTPVTDLCKGGFEDLLALSYAVHVHPSLGAESNLLTCSQPSGRTACTGGCNPYLGINCASPSGGVVNPSGSAASGTGCSNFFVGMKSCPAGGLDTSSSWLTSAAKNWRVIPSTIDPNFAGKFTTTGRGVFMSADLRVAPDNRLSVVPAAGWSAADIADVKRYLMTRGPMTVSVGADSFFMGSWRKDRPYTGTCTTRVNHAVTLIGWLASVNGVNTPSWILRNSCALLLTARANSPGRSLFSPPTHSSSAHHSFSALQGQTAGAIMATTTFPLPQGQKLLVLVATQWLCHLLWPFQSHGCASLATRRYTRIPAATWRQ